MQTVRFARSGGSKALGVIVYLLAGPFLAVAAGLIVGMPAYLVAKELMGLSENVSMLVCLSVAAVTLMAVVAWMVRDFRRRAAAEVVLSSDRVEVGESSRRIVMPLDRIESVFLGRYQLDRSLEFSAVSERVRLNPEIAPFSAIEGYLEAALIPRLCMKLEGRLQNGEIVAVRDGRAASWGRLLYGLFQLTVVPLAFLSLRFGIGIRAYKSGVSLIRAG